MHQTSPTHVLSGIFEVAAVEGFFLDLICLDLDDREFVGVLANEQAMREVWPSSHHFFEIELRQGNWRVISCGPALDIGGDCPLCELEN